MVKEIKGLVFNEETAEWEFDEGYLKIGKHYIFQMSEGSTLMTGTFVAFQPWRTEPGLVFARASDGRTHMITLYELVSGAVRFVGGWYDINKFTGDEFEKGYSYVATFKKDDGTSYDALGVFSKYIHDGANAMLLYHCKINKETGAKRAFSVSAKDIHDGNVSVRKAFDGQEFEDIRDSNGRTISRYHGTDGKVQKDVGYFTTFKKDSLKIGDIYVIELADNKFIMKFVRFKFGETSAEFVPVVRNQPSVPTRMDIEAWKLTTDDYKIREASVEEIKSVFGDVRNVSQAPPYIYWKDGTLAWDFGLEL